MWYTVVYSERQEALEWDGGDVALSLNNCELCHLHWEKTLSPFVPKFFYV